MEKGAQNSPPQGEWKTVQAEDERRLHRVNELKSQTDFSLLVYKKERLNQVLCHKM